MEGQPIMSTAAIATVSTQHPTFGWRAAVIPLVFLALWEVSIASGLLQSPLAPSVTNIIERAWTEILDGRLLLDISASLLRDLTGFALGSLTGILAGFLLGLSRWSDALFTPTLNAVKQIALLAWIPLMSAWFGTGEEAKIAFIAFAAFIPVVINTREGAVNVAREHIELTRVLQLNPWQVWIKVAFPSALPAVLTGLKLALIYAWLATVAAEYFMTVGPGLGGLMTEGRERSHMDLVLLGVFLLGLIGFILNTLFSVLAQRIQQRWPH
jgi:sulfonate transport system permease protein